MRPSGKLADRPRRVAATKDAATPRSDAPPRTNGAASTDLKPYAVFSQSLSPVTQTPADQIVENVVRIVSVEGPMTGWRIHQVYKMCAQERESHDEFSRLLNRAISAAERTRRIVTENPFNQTGNKPRTFRLPAQSTAVARELGPRSIDIVPPAEMVQYCRNAATGEAPSDDELVRRVGRMLGIRQPTTDLRNAVLAAKRLNGRNGQGRSARPAAEASAVRRAESACPSCFTVHAGECV